MAPAPGLKDSKKAGRWREAQIDGETHRIPDVPWISQNPPTAYCVIASLKMAVDFFFDIEMGLNPAAASPAPSLGELASLTRTDPMTGTQVGDELYREFNGRFGGLELLARDGVSIADMRSLTTQGVIVIPCYFPVVCENPTSEIPGVGHACVYLGHGPRTVLIHNPWYGRFHHWDRSRFVASHEQAGAFCLLVRKRTSIKQRATLSTPAAEGAANE